jgi:hypothetical protein
MPDNQLLGVLTREGAAHVGEGKREAGDHADGSRGRAQARGLDTKCHGGHPLNVTPIAPDLLHRS